MMTASSFSPGEGPEITVSDIAKIAGVSRAAVSNWRSRFKDFPVPVRTGPSGGDVFRLGDVERWLEEHGKKRRKFTGGEVVWHAADALRGEEPIDRVIELACIALALRRAVLDNPEFEEASLLVRTGEPNDRAQMQHALNRFVPHLEAVQPGLGDAITPLLEASPRSVSFLLDAVFQLATPADLADAFDSLLDRRSRSRDATYTPQAVRNLMVRLARPRPGQVVLDPTAGEAGLLVDAGESTDGPLSLIGQEVNPNTWRLGAINFFLHDTPGRLALGNSLLNDAFPDLRADVVLCDPPYQLRQWGAERVASDPRWMFGVPTDTSADLAWVQHVVHHLSPGGLAYLLLPISSLFRGGREGRIRAELLKRGAVDAIVALPAGTASATAIRLALWVLRRPGTSIAGRPVLFVDASQQTEEGTPRKRQPLTEELIASIAEVVDAWQQAPDTFESRPGFAASIPAIELLATEADLTPRKWVESPTAAKAGDVLQDIVEIRNMTAEHERKFAAAPKLPEHLPLTPAEAAPPWRISDLVADGHVTILRATRITPDDYRSSGTRVITQRDLRGKTPREEWRFVNVDELDRPPVITKPGDVLMATIGEKPYAVVEETGGIVLGGSLEALRIHVGWLDPVVVAALLGSSETARFLTGGAIKHVKLRDLAIPRLMPEEMRELRSLLEQLQKTEELAAETAGGAAELRARIVDGLAAGVIRPTSGEDAEAVEGAGA